MSFIRLTLLPTTPSSPVLQMDVPATDLVLSNGKFQPVQTARTVTLTGVPVDHAFTPFDDLNAAIAITDQQTQEVKVVYREPVDTSTYTDTSAVTAADPTGGAGTYGITLKETRISFAQVNVAD